MKHNRLSPLLGGSAALTFTMAGVAIPGCEAVLRDPQAFFDENTCKFFNCDTLFFLEEEHDEDEVVDDHDESEPNGDQ